MNGVTIRATGVSCGEPDLTRRGPWDADLPADAVATRHVPPADDFVPRNTRRRISRLIAMALYALRDAGGLDAPEATPLLFASANGEINTIGAILASLLSDEPSVSPTAFHNSVHNAAPGYWSILAKRFAATTTLSQGPLSFELALLEGWARLANGDGEVLLCGGDEAIESADWADPAHCTHDFCGAVRLSAGLEGPGLARIRAVRFLPAAGDGAFDDAVAALVREWRPDRVVVAEPGYPGASPFGGPHPMAGLAHLLRFVRAPGPAGTLLQVRRGAEGAVAIVASREAHD